MAARFWRWVLGCELAIAATLALILGAGHYYSAIAAGLTALGVLAGMLVVLIAISVVVAQALAGREWRLSDAANVLRATVTEALQFGRAQVAMSAEPWLGLRDVAAPRFEGRARPVLLIHGILCNRGIWAPLYERLCAAGFAPISAVNLEPLGSPIESYCASVKRELLSMRHESRGAPVAIVAHSMGGLVARSLLQSMGPEFISRIVTVASPHHGSELARCLPLAAARQMRPDSSWLLALNAAQEGRLPVPITSIYSREDNLLTPAQSATLNGAQSHEVRGLGHFGLLRSRRVLDYIVNVLASD